MPESVFPPHAVVRRVNAEPPISTGAGRALLLQLAHPAVAQGVADHSEFKANPFKRLQGTLEAMYVVVFGPRDLAEGVGRRIRWIHEFVVGPSYAANDPANLLWVHATLVDTAMRCHDEMLRPLRPAEAETYYQEMTRVATFFGLARDDQPATLAEFRSYFSDTVRSLHFTDTGRDLARFIVRPELPLDLHVPLAPVVALHRLVTLGLTPAHLRDELGLRWGPREQRRFEAATGSLRRVFRSTPRLVRTLPTLAQGPLLIRQARRHVAAFDARQAQRVTQAARRST
ncbi:MAG TPA: oxygenase MpaB family protein [Acidimicrobiales bacterium]|jgi:uncharacterized protein (DUF2236 family)|nr:oxygenase MpaB family protein [Acidimicrobiales bacterium]